MGIINYQFIHLIVTKLLLAVVMELSNLTLWHLAFVMRQVHFNG